MNTAYNHPSYCILVHNKIISFHVCSCYRTITRNRPVHALISYFINNTLPLCSNLLGYPSRGIHQLALQHRYTPALPNRDDLQLKAQHFFNNGLAANTRYTYSTGQQRFKTFCQAINASTLPTSEATLTIFITHLATKNISYKTITVYLSAVPHMHVSAGMFSEFCQQLTPRLQLTLKGIQCSQTLSHSPKPWLLITVQLLQNIYTYLSQQPNRYNNILMWAACCLSFLDFSG